MKKKRKIRYLFYVILFIILLGYSCVVFIRNISSFQSPSKPKNSTSDTTHVDNRKESSIKTQGDSIQKSTILWNPSWEYADFATLMEDEAILYTQGETEKPTIFVNAGHGTPGGEKIKNYCHPDKSPKVTGGSTAQGAIKAYGVAYGCVLSDGTPEHEATLELSVRLKEKLLSRGYRVIMVRDENHPQTGFDNIARTVLANENADVHIALHYDSTDTDKGAFFSDVPEDRNYQSMAPVSRLYPEHRRFGQSIIHTLKEHGIKTFAEGSVPIDLTQTSFSKIPSCVLEVGDTVSDRSEEELDRLANAIAEGIDRYFEK